MKKTILLTTMLGLILLASSCSSTKKEFKITGKVAPEVAMDSISIYNSQQEKLYSAPVENNTFVLKGSLNEPRKLMLGNENAHFSFEIILENADYEMDIDKEGFVAIKGGKIHSDVLGYLQNKDYKDMIRERNQKSEELFADIDMDNEEQLTKAREMLDVYDQKVFDYRDKETERVIEGTYPAMTKMFALLFSSNFKKYPPEKVKELLAEYQKEIGDHPDMVSFLQFMQENEEMMKKLAAVANGAPFKEIIGKDRNGNTVKLSEVIAKNDYTILEFWASWCGPCRGEIPNLKKAYEKYKGKGLEILSVSVDSDHKSWTTALDEEKPTWINILVEGDFKNPGIMEYGLMGVPSSYLITKEGVIVAGNNELREFELDRTLARVIK